MFVVKRDGRKEDVKFDKITSRINKLCYGLDNRFVDSVKISQKVCIVTVLEGSPLLIVLSPLSLLVSDCLPISVAGFLASNVCLPVCLCLFVCLCLCLCLCVVLYVSLTFQ